MDPKHRTIIRENTEGLISNTENLENIIEILLKDKIINEFHARHITNIPEIKEKTRAFYKLIQGRGPTAFLSLRRTLRKTGNLKAEDILEKSRVKCPFYENVVIPAQETLSVEPIISSSSTEDTDPQQESELLENIEKNVNSINVIPAERFLDIEEENPPNGVYRMRSNPRGYAIIINIHQATGHKERTGSEVDMEKLVTLFTGLGYSVEQHTNLNHKELEEKIWKFSVKPELAYVDSTVVFIMSHGSQYEDHDRCVELVASDGIKVNTHRIIEYFVNSSSLLTYKSRKPRMFFFQACRGKNVDSGCSGNQSAIDSKVKCYGSGSRSYEDMIIIYSTIPGYYSKRDAVEGGWFVNKFCKVVSQNAHKYDLDSMLGQVDEEMRLLRSKEYGYQTLEVCKQGSFKKIYFNPGLTEQ